jgi:hypothetical protein
MKSFQLLVIFLVFYELFLNYDLNLRIFRIYTIIYLDVYFYIYYYAWILKINYCKIKKKESTNVESQAVLHEPQDLRSINLENEESRPSESNLVETSDDQPDETSLPVSVDTQNNVETR